MKQRICILATHHHYQHDVPRIGFARTVRELIDLWKPDFIGEEWSDRIEEPSYAHLFAEVLKTKWDNIDLRSEERTYFPDSNSLGVGTQQDLTFTNKREWVWLIAIVSVRQRQGEVPTTEGMSPDSGYREAQNSRLPCRSLGLQLEF